MGKILAVLYGIVAYLVFLASFLYAVGFVGDFLVPRSIDTPTPTGTAMALLIDALVLGLFAIQHSVMARPVAPRDLAPTHAGNRLRLVSCVGNQWGQTRLIRQSYI